MNKKYLKENETTEENRFNNTTETIRTARKFMFPSTLEELSRANAKMSNRSHKYSQFAAKMWTKPPRRHIQNL